MKNIFVLLEQNISILHFILFKTVIDKVQCNKMQMPFVL